MVRRFLEDFGGLGGSWRLWGVLGGSRIVWEGEGGSTMVRRI